MLIAVLNASTLVTNDDTLVMTRACAQQLRYHVGPTWDAHAAACVFFPAKSSVPPGAHTITLFDDSDQAGALGWHTEERGGLVYGRVFCRPVLGHGGDVLTKALSVSSVLSHEAVELRCDPNVNLWADDGSGKRAYAMEACDPVESDAYIVRVDGRPIAVSNFVTPSWFDSQAAPGSRFDWMGKVQQPVTMSTGGYVIVEEEGQVSQKFGAEYPEWKQATKQTPMSRTFRRLNRQAS